MYIQHRTTRSQLPLPCSSIPSSVPLHTKKARLSSRPSSRLHLLAAIRQRVTTLPPRVLRRCVVVPARGSSLRETLLCRPSARLTAHQPSHTTTRRDVRSKADEAMWRKWWSWPHTHKLRVRSSACLACSSANLACSSCFSRILMRNRAILYAIRLFSWAPQRQHGVELPVGLPGPTANTIQLVRAMISTTPH
jgi:hypothetical protein